MEKVLVTGAAGFIASNLIPKLIDRKYKVIGVDDLSRGTNLDKVKDKMIFYECDINSKAFKKIVQKDKPDYIIHLAAWARVEPSVSDPMGYLTNNVIGTLNVLLAGENIKVKKIIYASSSGVYGDGPLPYNETLYCNPKNPYTLTKLQGEQWALLFDRLYNVPTLCFRFFNVYGENMTSGQYATVMHTFLEQLRANKPLTIVGDGEQSRDFTHIKDIVRGIILGLESSVRGEVINLGGGRPVKVNEVANLVAGNDYPRVMGAKRAPEVRETLSDNTKAKKLLNWEPLIDIRDGIKDVK